MSELNRSHYNVGWNDTAHGILTWNGHKNWNSALEWALFCRQIARDCKPKTAGEHNQHGAERWTSRRSTWPS